jgi:hypothetical protein
MIFEFLLYTLVIGNACVAFADRFVIAKCHLRNEPKNEDIRPFLEMIGREWWQDMIENIYPPPGAWDELQYRSKPSPLACGLVGPGIISLALDQVAFEPTSPFHASRKSL